MKQIFTIVGMLLFGVSAFAVPARRGIHTVEQPNGDTIHIQLIGDEWWHAHYTADGYLIRQNDKGWWCYATWQEVTEPQENPRARGNRKVSVCTRKHVKDADNRSRCHKRWLLRHRIPNRNV